MKCGYGGGRSVNNTFRSALVTASSATDIRSSYSSSDSRPSDLWSDRSLTAALLDVSGMDSGEDYRRRDSRLHLAIAEAAGSPSLTTAVADIRTRVNELLDAIPLLATNIEHSDAQHRAIVAAILAGDAPAARQTMAEHLDGTAALLRGFL